MGDAPSDLDATAGDEATAEAETFDYDTHWVSAQVDAGLPFGVENKLVTGAVKFGLVPDILAAAYVVTQWSEISTPFLVASALTLAWVNVAPSLVWYYDERVLPQFFEKVTEIVVETDRLEEISRRYNRFYASYSPSFGLLWGGGFVLSLYSGAAFLRAQGMAGDGRVFFWTTLAYGAYVGLVLGEAGFSGPVTTLLLVRNIANADDLSFDIKPLHPDGLGGLSTVGYYAIRTTVLWSTASLLIPLAFQLISGPDGNLAMAAVTAMYIGTIVASFVYPTLKINRRSEQLRGDILREIRGEYLELQERVEASTGDAMDDVNRRLEMQRLRNKYDDYATVRLYPMQTQILARLAGSVLLPLVFLLLEFYLPELI